MVPDLPQMLLHGPFMPQPISPQKVQMFPDYAIDAGIRADHVRALLNQADANHSVGTNGSVLVAFIPPIQPH